jgi:hypothetical protein
MTKKVSKIAPGVELHFEEPIHGVDATPDRMYPIRILQAHLHGATTCSVVTEPPALGVTMNELQAQRAKILSDAITVLEAFNLTAQPLNDKTLLLPLDENHDAAQITHTD